MMEMGKEVGLTVEEIIEYQKTIKAIPIPIRLPRTLSKSFSGKLVEKIILATSNGAYVIKSS